MIYATCAGMGIGVVEGGIDVAGGRDVPAGETSAVGMAGAVDGTPHDATTSKKSARQRRNNLV